MSNLNKAVELYGKVDSAYTVVRNNITRRKVGVQALDNRSVFSMPPAIDARLVRELALIHKGQFAHRKILSALCILRDNGDLTDSTAAAMLSMSMLRLQAFVKDIIRKHAIRATAAERVAMSQPNPPTKVVVESSPRDWLDVDTEEQFMSLILEEVQRLYTDAIQLRIVYFGTMNRKVIESLSRARDLHKWVNAQNYFADLTITDAEIRHLDLLGIDLDATKWSLDQTV